MPATRGRPGPTEPASYGRREAAGHATLPSFICERERQGHRGRQQPPRRPRPEPQSLRPCRGEVNPGVMACEGTEAARQPP